MFYYMHMLISFCFGIYFYYSIPKYFNKNALPVLTKNVIDDTLTLGISLSKSAMNENLKFLWSIFENSFSRIWISKELGFVDFILLPYGLRGNKDNSKLQIWDVVIHVRSAMTEILDFCEALADRDNLVWPIQDIIWG